MSQASTFDRTIIDRLEKFRKSLNLNKTQMGKSIDLSPQRYMNITNGNNSLTTMHLQALSKAYRDLSLRWLLNEEGEMLLSHLDDELDRRIHKLEVENELLIKLIRERQDL